MPHLNFEKGTNLLAKAILECIKIEKNLKIRLREILKIQTISLKIIKLRKLTYKANFMAE